MKDVFYSKSDDRLFWVAGYTAYDNTSNVFEKIRALQECSKTFSDWAKCDQKEVKTVYVDASRRYKFMRVFFVDAPKQIPADAFSIRNDDGWGMFQFLKD
jgi:hypothetical protein